MVPNLYFLIFYPKEKIGRIVEGKRPLYHLVLAWRPFLKQQYIPQQILKKSNKTFHLPDELEQGGTTSLPQAFDLLNCLFSHTN